MLLLKHRIAICKPNMFALKAHGKKTVIYSSENIRNKWKGKILTHIFSNLISFSSRHEIKTNYVFAKHLRLSKIAHAVSCC